MQRFDATAAAAGAESVMHRYQRPPHPYWQPPPPPLQEDSMLQSIVLTFVRSKPEGATVPDVVKHCVGMGACSDALRVQRVITTLLEDVQVYEKDARLLSL